MGLSGAMRGLGARRPGWRGSDRPVHVDCARRGPRAARPWPPWSSGLLRRLGDAAPCCAPGATAMPTAPTSTSTPSVMPRYTKVERRPRRRTAPAGDSAPRGGSRRAPRSGRRCASSERLGIDLQQPRVAAHHAAREGRARQGVEALLLERLELARRELELCATSAQRRGRALPRAAAQFLSNTVSRFSQIGLAAGPGTPARRDSAGAAGSRRSARSSGRPACARCAARATAIRRSE